MDYIIHNTSEPMYNKWFLVKAANKKDAISKTYEKYGIDDEYLKKDYMAYSIKELYNSSPCGSPVCLE